MSRRLLAGSLLLSFAASAFSVGMISGGPMISYAEMTEVGIWIQTTRDAKVQLSYRKDGAAKWLKSDPIQAAKSVDNIAHFRLTGLDFGAQYQYQVHINGREEKLDRPLVFKTQPHWRWRTDPPAIRFAIGSCAYSTDTPFDRPGQPYGGDYEIFSSLTKEKPDFMVWMGDNWYYREPDWLTESAMRYRARFDRSQPYYQALLALCPQYATWDDHDFGPNDSDRSFRLKDAALSIFSDYFPTASPRGTQEAKGAYFRFEWGDIEFFMLDDRYHRTPNRWPNREEAQMLGAEQLQWLKESLSNSNAPFKIIVNGGQMVQPMKAFESFLEFPTERKSLFDHIAEAKIRGVLFLSGDRHATELLKIDWPGAAYPFYDFTSSPLSSGATGSEREAANPARVPGTWVTRKRNYGIIEVNGPREDRVMTMLAKDKDGKTLWSHTIAAKDLAPPR